MTKNSSHRQHTSLKLSKKYMHDISLKVPDNYSLKEKYCEYYCKQGRRYTNLVYISPWFKSFCGVSLIINHFVL